MNNKIKLQIDNIEVEVEAGQSLLEASRKANIEIPTLCYHRDLSPNGTCGLCVVEIEGQSVLKRACVTPATQGMVIHTNTPRIRMVRKNILELIVAVHPKECLECIRHGSCELQKWCEKFNIRKIPYEWTDRGLPIDNHSRGIVRDMNKCISCGRCVNVCRDNQSVYAIDFHKRGANTIVSPPLGITLEEGTCVNCGQCIVYCPVGALYEKEDLNGVWEAINDPTKEVVVQIAPATRVIIAEAFGVEPGQLTVGQLYTALRRIGFDKVFDTNFTADLTIMEEGSEFLERVKEGGPFPMITSCSPGWVRFAETYYHDFLNNLSTAKSPQMMMGALLKTYYPETNNKDPKNIVSVSIMPCTAKKFESSRPEMNASGYRDVDFVLTTRELARMIKEAGLEYNHLPESKADPLLSSYTGAGTIFGSTGGVMEAALRTAYEIFTKKTLQRLEFESVRGFEGIKEAKVDLDGTEIRVAVAHGLGNARKLLDKVKESQKEGKLLYHFIEIMACPGGCIGGGGQIIPTDWESKRKRMMALYQEDKNLPLRKSHENPEIKTIYEKYLKNPLSDKSHHLLHTHYKQRDPYNCCDYHEE